MRVSFTRVLAQVVMLLFWVSLTCGQLTAAETSDSAFNGAPPTTTPNNNGNNNDKNDRSNNNSNTINSAEDTNWELSWEGGPVADPASIVLYGDCRFTVLTSRLIRIERAYTSGNEDNTGLNDFGQNNNNNNNNNTNQASTSRLFEDRATLAILNRKFKEVAQFTQEISNDKTKLTLTTEHLVLEFTKQQPSGDTKQNSHFGRKKNYLGKEKYMNSDSADVNTDDNDTLVFGAGKLKIRSRIKAFKQWTYGDPNEPLPGTIRSLDLTGPITLDCSLVTKLMKRDEHLHCIRGLISRRDGWVLHNDTDTPRFDIKGQWWDLQENGQTGHNVVAEDLYFFGYGLDFKAALGDYARVGGRVPLVPKHVLGAWWSRWYDMDSDDVIDYVNEHRLHGLPLDTFILDLNWHLKNGWGGYTFDRRLHPWPKHLLGQLKSEGLHVSLSLHDDDGVGPFEDQHGELAKYMNLTFPAGAKNTTIPFESCTNKSFALGLEDIVLGPLTDAGVDFWWVDWQQGGNHGGCPGQKYNTNMWLNKLRTTRSARMRAQERQPKRNTPYPHPRTTSSTPASLGTSTRDIVLSRWGGLGNHRYQIGFSGDVDRLEWSRLAYQPYFTASAANVLFGFWSHDTTGPATNPELHVRWVQWAAWSPQLRTHERGMSAGGCFNKFPSTVIESSCAVDTPWSLPHEYFAPIRDVMRGRYELFPYLYNLAREVHDTGLSPVRPMYHEFPTHDMAYAISPNGSFSQYMLGDHILVSPIVAPGNNTPGAMLSRKDIWIPPGCWVERNTGWRVCGPGVQSGLGFALEQVPVFVRAGGVISCNPLEDEKGIPLTDLIGGVSRNRTIVRFDIFHGIDEKNASHPMPNLGSGYAYDDDGETLAYMQQEADAGISNVSVTYEWTSGVTAMVLDVVMVRPIRVASEAFIVQIRLLDVFPPENVKLLKGLADIGTSGGKIFNWRYNARYLATEVDVVFPASSVVVNRASNSEAQRIHAQVEIKWNPKLSMLSKIRKGVSAIMGVRGAIANARLAKHAFDKVRKAPVEKKLTMSPLARLASLFVTLERLTQKMNCKKGDDLVSKNGLVGELEEQEKFIDVIGQVRDLLSAALKEVASVPQRSDDDNRMHAYASELLNESLKKTTLLSMGEASGGIMFNKDNAAIFS